MLVFVYSVLCGADSLEVKFKDKSFDGMKLILKDSDNPYMESMIVFSRVMRACIMLGKHYLYA